jgi:predicted ATPase
MSTTPPKRYALTGAPGTGKTSVLRALQELGFSVVEEAATDVIGMEQKRGVNEPWQEAGFIDKVAVLQRHRQQRPDSEAWPDGGQVGGPGPADGPVQAEGSARADGGRAGGGRAGGGTQVHDRSTLCTLALARFLRQPVTPLLAAEVDRVLREQVFEREVFLIRPIGFVERTAARRISYEDSLVFERLHEAVYREHGFEIIDVPPASAGRRAAMIAERIASLR